MCGFADNQYSAALVYPVFERLVHHILRRHTLTSQLEQLLYTAFMVSVVYKKRDAVDTDRGS